MGEITNSINPSAWNPVQLDLNIPFDLERSPLQIKTNSTKGSGDEIRVSMKNTGGKFIGAVAVRFHAPDIKFKISKCTHNDDFVKFVTEPPEEVNKTWTIRKTNTRISIECNGVLLRKFNLASKDQCVSTWGGDIVKKIAFTSTSGHDTASISYRAKPGI